jgi:Na+:H+ antiporter, NhaA family
MTTAIALVIGSRPLLGCHVPHNVRVFVFSLAIIDDTRAVSVTVLSHLESITAPGLVLTGTGLCIVFVMPRLGVRSIALFWVLGIATGFAMHEFKLHAALLGIVLGLMTPASPWVGQDLLAVIMRCTRDGLRSL